MADRRLTLRTVVASGDRVKALEALRDFLAGALQGTEDDRAVAPISKRLSEVMAELDALRPPEVKSRRDELAEQRSRRRADVADLAAERQQRRPGSGPAAGVGEPAT